MSDGNLPRTWAVATLADLVSSGGVFADGDWVESKDQDPAGEVRLTQLADVGDGRFRDRSDRFMTTEAAARLGCTFLQQGDVLVARMPDPLGRACVFPGAPRPCVTVVDVAIVRPGTPDVVPHWLMHSLNARPARSQIAAMQRGSTRKRISRKNLATIEVNVPPAVEQHRIVAALDSYFTRLDAAEAALKRVRANLERYRASVLKAAVEGRLVETEAAMARREGRQYEPASVLLERILVERRSKWEEAELAKMVAKGKPPANDKWKEKYEEPTPPDTDGLPQLPEGWCWSALDQLAELIRNGCSTAPHELRGVPILRISAVRPLRIDMSDVRFLPPPLEQYGRDIARAGDVLFTRYNGSPALVGVAAAVREHSVPVVHPDKLIKVRCTRGMVDPSFLEVAASAGASRQHIERCTRTTAGQAGISGGDLKNLPVPLPPFVEQSRISDATTKLFGIADHISQSGVLGLARCARLRQSILKWAFEGRLVDQDPNDEPASVLLERIRGEREAAASAPSVGRIARKRKARA